MAETKTLEKEEITWSPEEMEMIQDLISFFNTAPGQVDIPDIDQVSEEAEASDENAEDSELEEEAEEKSTKPKVDMDKFKDLDDLDNLLSDAETIDDVKPANLNEDSADSTDSSSFDDFSLDDTEIPQPISSDSETKSEQKEDDFSMPGLGDLGLGTEKQPENNDLSFPGLDGFETETSSETVPVSKDLKSDGGDELQDLTFPLEETSFEAESELPDFGGTEINDLDSGADSEESPISAPESDSTFDLGDLGAPDELGSIPDIGGTDFSDTDFGDSAVSEESKENFSEMSLGDIPLSEEITGTTEIADFENAAPISDAAEIPVSEPESTASDFDFRPPSLDELSPEVSLQTSGSSLDADLSALAAESNDDLSDAELKQLRDKLKSFPPGVRKEIIDTIIEDKISPAETKELVKRVLAEELWESIALYLEGKTGTTLDKTPEVKRSTAKVIVTRPQYTEAGIQRQQHTIQILKYGISVFALLVIIISTGWFFIYKPWRYKSLISKGKELILNSSGNEKNINEAEKIFTKALKYYPDKTEAYLQYGDVYSRVGMYDQSFEKLYARIVLPESPLQKFNNAELTGPARFWPALTRVPVARYSDSDHKFLVIDGIRWILLKPGAYVLTHLENRDDEARVLLALGSFHSNPARRFHKNYLRNNLVGMDYYRRILTFKVKTPWFESEDYKDAAIRGIGTIYYNQKEYYQSLQYFEKIIRQDPYNAQGQAGVIRALLKLYHESNDPRLVIQQHSIIKHQLKIEEKLPLHVLTALAAFYIDLPNEDQLRIEYNVSPVDQINGQLLKSRAAELLDISFRNTEEDIYGNKTRGNQFAEGYYQRGRYYAKTQKQFRMAMKMMEYAYKYNPAHFMALYERAEMLSDINDFDGALKHLQLAYEQAQPEKLELLGDRPEDETLLEADVGKIPLAIGRNLYLKAIRYLGDTGDWMRMGQTDAYNDPSSHDRQAFDSALDKIDQWFDKAEQWGIHDPQDRAELRYYSGWSWYARGNYKKSLSYWEDIDPEWQRKSRSIELAKSHALYRLATENTAKKEEYLEDALGYLLYLQQYYQKSAEKIPSPVASNKIHRRIFTRLSMIENNIGAIDEMMGDEKDSMAHYYRSMDYSRKISRENEIAHVNLSLGFKRAGLEQKEKYPVIMDFLPPKLTEDNQ